MNAPSDNKLTLPDQADDPGEMPNATSAAAVGMQSDAEPAPTTTFSIQDLLAEFETCQDGLTEDEVKQRQERFGLNTLPEEHTSAMLRFVGYFWGPIPWMIEVAAILSAIVQHWTDLIVILVLLLFNAVIGFWQESQAANAVAALKQKLALKARAKRDGLWKTVDAATLVPGDVLWLRLGEIVPADVKLFDGDYLSIDQSALTGESLPVSKGPGDIAYSGSIVRQGEMQAVVTATGTQTYFGKTAKLVSAAKSVSHFQQAVLKIGNYLIYLSVGLVVLLLAVQLYRGHPFLSLVDFALILTVAAIPVAMPAVLSVTMAIGALKLSKMKAIVLQLDAVEEMAGLDVLCSDKTGTLTQNRLTLGETVVLDPVRDAQDVILAAALASKTGNGDAIDAAVVDGLDQTSRLEGYQQEHFVPFDPVRKRTEAIVQTPDHRRIRVTKGTPQVVMQRCEMSDAQRTEATGHVDELARQGYRTLGVAEADEQDGMWRFLGLLPLFDPPRKDSAETIRDAKAHGIDVKMVTGDNVAIACEMSGQLGLGQKIVTAKSLFDGHETPVDDDAPRRRVPDDLAKKVEAAEGFAEVFPQHKFQIVRSLQQRGHIVGMTGDGVNDAPALKQADTGIAVSGATDAARAAAALVLTAPGLSTIIQAIEEARRIFERMNSYAIYRITETIRIMFFVVLAMVVFNFYPITAMLIILLALFNDVPIMTIAYDNTWLDPRPVTWNMPRVLSVSTVLGLIGVVETFGLLVAGWYWLGLNEAQLQSFLFLKLAIAGHLTLFVARTRKPMFTRPFPAPIMLWSAIGTKVLATLLVGFGLGLVTPVSWPIIGLVWVYCLAWIVIEDRVKLATYRWLDKRAAKGKRTRQLMMGSRLCAVEE